MRPVFSTVQIHYESTDHVAKDELFRQIGWDDLIDNEAYSNTCAIRMSLALIKSGMIIGGRIPIHRGPFKGRMIEPGHEKLSQMLATGAYFGTPEKFRGPQAEHGIGARKGVVSFWHIPGYLDGRGGHIDIISMPFGSVLWCGSGCYWDADEMWFWELR